MSRYSPVAVGLLWSTLLAACGGGGGSGAAAPTPPVPPPPTMPFGLDAREPLAPLNLPTGSAGLSSYALEESFPNLNFPSAIFVAGVPGEDRMVVVQQSGEVLAFANDPAVATTTTVLDLSAQISFGGERGLLGLAFDPAFVQNRFLYVHYSTTGVHRSVIARFTWDAVTDVVDPASEKLVLEVAQPFSNHNGGMLAFGPDNLLYVAFGDGGSGGDPQNNAQSPDNLLGSLLRLDVHPADPADPYDVPATNPFVGQSGFRPETYAYGLRNPFRFSFDRQTGELWLGDVGQRAREEIDLIEAGGNYGWRVFEGDLPYDNSANTLPDSAFTPPVIDYDHGQGVAVIGGYVYRGNSIPSLQGRYLYTDLQPGPVWALDYDGASVIANDVITNSTGSSTSFGEDNDGEVYLLVGSRVNNFIETSGGGSSAPDLLSETGLFSSLANLTPAAGLIEYGVNAPFWSDGARKRRWLALPDGTRIDFSATGIWDFPPGTVIVKHFELELVAGDPGSARRLETRLLVNSDSGWQGYTYKWNAAETDADLLTGREFETITVDEGGGVGRDQLYEYPSRTDCLVCHTQVAGFTLGLETRQQNGDFVYPAVVDNQLRSWNHIELFDRDIGAATQYDAYPDPTDTGAGVDARARTYLDVNCAQCHQPGGPTGVTLDLRVDTALASTGTVDVAPTAGDLGIVDARIIAPGERARSVLWERLRRLDENRMPPLGTHVVDVQAVTLLGDWIDSL